MNHPEEVGWVTFPTGHDATGVVRPGKEAFDLPAPPRATGGPAVLRACFAVRVMPRDHLNPVGRPQVPIEPIAVIPPIADQSRGERVEARGPERGINERDFMRRSACHVDATGRPWPSLIAMILLPLPRRVGPMAEPLFSPS